MAPSKRLKRYYDQFNMKWFGSRLPADVSVGWDESLPIKDLAITYHLVDDTTRQVKQRAIAINPILKFSPALTRLVLLHEMAHIAVFPNIKHGKKLTTAFNTEMLRLSCEGALIGLW